MNWNLENGEHQRAGYSYRVVDKIEPTVGYEPRVPEHVPLRKRFSADHAVAVPPEPQTTDWKKARARLEKSVDGILIHEIFESLRYTKDIRPEILEKRFGLRANEIRDAIDFVKSQTEVPMVELLQEGFVEWGYSMVEGGSRFDRRIDLWGRVEGYAWLVDYKTGDPDRVEEAFKQLREYSLALKRYGIEEEIKMAVIYPLAKKIFVRDAPEEAEVLPELFESRT
jgi:ATP-dependent helicase/nuclease subunit A